jgi:hypothetical protein
MAHINHGLQSHHEVLLSQELLATLTLEELAQEDEPLTKPPTINSVRQPRYASQALNSWSAEHSPSQLKPKQELKGQVLSRPSKHFKPRKTARKIYEHTSTTLLQLNPSAEADHEAAKRQWAARDRAKTHSNRLTQMSEKNKLLGKRLKK